MNNDWVSTPKGRNWRLMWSTDDACCYMIEWPPGVGLAMHSHGGSEAFVCVVDGEIANSSQMGNSEPTGHVMHRSGSTIYVAPHEMHDIFNPSRSNWATTMHYYTPPLRGDAVYLEYDNWGFPEDHPWGELSALDRR